MFVLVQFTKEREPAKYLAHVLNQLGHTKIAKLIDEFNRTEDLYPYTAEAEIEVKLKDVSRSGTTNCFTMDRIPRGVCGIVLNEPSLRAEANQLVHIFERFGFIVRLWIYKTAEEITQLFRETAVETVKYNYNAVVLMTICHGEDEMILGKYGQLDPKDNYYDPKDKVDILQLIDIFSSVNCPSLIHKPKVLIFNCCRMSMYFEELA